MRIALVRTAAVVVGVMLGAPLLSGCVAQTVDNQVRDTAADAQVQTQLVNAKTALEAYKATNNALPSSIGSNLSSFGWTTQPGITLQYKKGSGANAGKYCILGTGKTGTTWVITSSVPPTASTTCPSSF